MAILLRAWLKEIRKSTNLSQKKAAEKAGISPNYYSYIEAEMRGNNLPVKTAKSIASVLNFDWRLFYEDTDEIAEKKSK